jgi:hypothetical protein
MFQYQRDKYRHKCHQSWLAERKIGLLATFLCDNIENHTLGYMRPHQTDSSLVPFIQVGVSHVG